ncbi:MAG: hypothetical protein OXN44_12425 [Acidimicrobiaceae bacterium]|nr:hypothetical protein [Acidimicrobiaceae bacterium]MDE0608198.1 hypothetical protein [Acidimicrobiaceae bacterium]
MAEPEFRSSVTTLTATPAGAPALTDESALTKASVRAQVGASPLGVDFTRTAKRDGVLIAAIRPDEWLLLGSANDVEALLATARFDASVNRIDITHSRLCLRLTGARSASALEKVCSLDFDDTMFPDGATGSASVAKVSSDLIRDDIDGEPSYLLLADRSFGQYLYDAIHDATTEFADAL